MYVSEIIIAGPAFYYQLNRPVFPPEDHLKEVRLEIMSLYVFSIPPGPDLLALAS